MLKPVTIFVLLLFSMDTYTQSRYGKLLDDRAIHPTHTYSGDLYVGIDNPLIINDSLFNKYDSIDVTSNNGIILSGKDYSLIPLRPGSLRIVIEGYLSGNRYIIGYRNFAVHRLPPQRLMLNDRILESFTKVPIEKIASTEELKVYVSDDIIDSDEWYYVSEFTIGYTYGSMFVSCTNIGDTIRDETIKFLKNLKPGQIVTLNAMITNDASVVKASPTIRLLLIGPP